LGLKKNLVRSLTLTFEAMRPENRFSNVFSIMSSKVTHNRFGMIVKNFF
jgi:hypothetical protein